MELPRVLIVNTSLIGANGNTAVLLDYARSWLPAHVMVSEVTLAAGVDYAQARTAVVNANALIFGTGTYWDSWSHLLQKFLEDATPDEGSAVWLGKPAGVIVTMHSVGGKAVLSRLQGVFNTLGCLIPPMCGVVYSAVNQAALEAAIPESADVWSPDDVRVLCHNLLVPLGVGGSFESWPSDRGDLTRRWIRLPAGLRNRGRLRSEDEVPELPGIGPIDR
jgi:chromate reductase